METLKEIAFKHGLLIDEVIELFRDPAIGPHIPAVKALQEELDRVRSQFVAEVASIEAGANKIIDERMAQLAGGEVVGVVQHLHELNDEWLQKLPIGTKLYTAPAIKQQVAEDADEPKRPDRLVAENAIYGFLCRRGIHTDFHMAEDGDDGWSFWILHEDTTSYVHADLSIEWYGTSYGEEEPTHPVSANQPDSGKVPPGYALVPIEPTEAMHDAGVDADDSDFERGVGPNVSTIYRAMLAAAPSAPIAEGDE